MSISLNGTSQYVSLGTAVDIYRTRPFSIAVVYDTSAWVDGTAYGLYGQGNNNSGTGASWHLYRLTTNDLRYTWYTASSTSRDATTVGTVLTGTGWHLLIATHFINGANSNAYAMDYSYNSSSWITGSISSSQGAPTAPGASDVTLIGAQQRASIDRFFKGLISWVAIFDYDVTNGGSTSAPDVTELVNNGAWNLNDANCKLFIPFDNAATDLSTGGHNGTLVGSPSYGTAGPGETAPSSGSSSPIYTHTKKIFIPKSVRFSRRKLG